MTMQARIAAMKEQNYIEPLAATSLQANLKRRAEVSLKQRRHA
jgi:hypothetical protein